MCRPDKSQPDSSPEPSISHRSAPSFYDNLPGPRAPDGVPKVSEMESSFREYRPGPESDRWSEGGSDEAKPEMPDRREPTPDSVFEQGERVKWRQESDWPQSQKTDGAPKAPPPVPPADPLASALRGLLTDLQQYVVRQHEAYEARIASLEERKEELEEEVLLLRSNLWRQRHWYRELRAKIGQSESRRAAAERRNSALQKDFFDTFGDLNHEAKKTENIIGSFRGT